MLTKCSILIDNTKDHVVIHNEWMSDSQSVDLVLAVAKYGQGVVACPTYVGGQKVPLSQRVIILGPCLAVSALTLAVDLPLRQDYYFAHLSGGPVLLVVERSSTFGDAVIVHNGVNLIAGAEVSCYPLMKLDGFIDPIYFCAGERKNMLLDWRKNYPSQPNKQKRCIL